MKRLFTPLFLIFWLCYAMQAQDEFTCPRLYLGETIATAGDTVTLAVRADDLREMIGLQTKITWDTTQVRLLDITHFNLPNLGSNNFTPISAANPMGAVTMSWFSAFLEPLDLPDSTALFSLCFLLHPSFTGQTGIRFTGGSPTEIIYDPAHPKAAPIPTLIDGQIATMGPMVRLHEACVRNEGACGITRGTIRSTPAGGISPYAYIWSGPNGFSSNKEMLSELPAGIYQLTITDASGMHRTSTYEIQSNKEKPLNIQLEETCKTEDSVRIMLRNEINEEIAFLGSNGQSGYGQSIAFDFPTRTIYSVSATNNSGCTQIFDGITTAFCPKDAPEKNHIVIAARTANNTDTVCLPVQLEVIQRIKETNLSLLWDSAQVSWSHWSPHKPASSVNVASSSATIVIDTILHLGFHHLGAACFSLMDGPDTILAITGNQSTFTSTMDTLIVPSVMHGTIFRPYEPQPVNLYIPDTTVVNGSHFCLPMRTDGQQDIMGIQFALSWDNQALSFQGVQLDQLPPSAHSLYNSNLAIQEGILAVSWHNDDHLGIDLSKGATLFEVCFQTEGPEGVVPIKLNRSVLPVKLIYADQSQQDANISGGRIQKLELVFPGDTNADGIVDYRDLANLGYAFGRTGPPRASSNLNFNGYLVNPWGDAFRQKSLDHRFADTNGDGTINYADTFAIHLNYGKRHSYAVPDNIMPNHPEEGIPLYLDMDTLTAGQTIEIPIILGTAQKPVPAIYNFQAILDYDPLLVEAGSIHFCLNDSWIGHDPAQLLSIYQENSTDGQLALAISRVNGQDTMGFGCIGSIILRIKDDIYTSETVQNTFYFIDAELMTVQEQPLPLAPEIRPYIIKPMTTKTQNILDQNQILIYPNPSRKQLFWTTERTDIMVIDIFNIRGQRTHHLFKSDGSGIDISNLPDGLYQVHFRTLEGTISKRFVVTGN